jgi:hypothetical protein
MKQRRVGPMVTCWTIGTGTNEDNLPARFGGEKKTVHKDQMQNFFTQA